MSGERQYDRCAYESYIRDLGQEDSTLRAAFRTAFFEAMRSELTARQYEVLRLETVEGSLKLLRGTLSPLDTPPVPDETGGDNPLSSAQRTRPRRCGAGRGKKVRYTPRLSWRFLRGALRSACPACFAEGKMRQEIAHALRAQKARHRRAFFLCSDQSCRVQFIDVRIAEQAELVHVLQDDAAVGAAAVDAQPDVALAARIIPGRNRSIRCRFLVFRHPCQIKLVILGRESLLIIPAVAFLRAAGIALLNILLRAVRRNIAERIRAVLAGFKRKRERRSSICSPTRMLRSI